MNDSQAQAGQTGTASGARRPGGPRRLFVRLLPVAVIVLALTLVFATGLQRYLSLDELQRRRGDLLGLVHAHPVQSTLAYMGLYLLVVALSLPGALIMTLSGGFLFGPIWGTAAAVVGASAGAVVMFLVARTALGDALRRRAEQSSGLLNKLERGIRENAFSALLIARLIPALPFWLVNVAAGLVKMPLRTYAVATVLGILPSTAIYAGIGTGLNRVFEQGGKPKLGMIFEPQVLAPLLGLAALSALPVLWKLWRTRTAAAGTTA